MIVHVYIYIYTYILYVISSIFWIPTCHPTVTLRPVTKSRWGATLQDRHQVRWNKPLVRSKPHRSLDAEDFAGKDRGLTQQNGGFNIEKLMLI